VAYESRHGVDLSVLAGARDIVLSSEFGSISLHMYPILDWVIVAQSIAAVIVTSVLACLWPARRISRLEAAEAMRS